MLAALETGEIFTLFEARDGVESLSSLYSTVREPWLTRAFLMYHARTGSARALELLARAPDAHARHLLDALLEQLRGERTARRRALAAAAPLVAARPAWLRRLPAAPLARELLRAARIEQEPVPLLHALLALAALLPAAPALAPPHLPELADALLRPPPTHPAHSDHLLLAKLALFHALYATHPCSLLDALRAECVAPTRASAERVLLPLLASVRLHPALLTGSRQREADATRWARLDTHDVVAETRRLAAVAPRPRIDPLPASPSPAPLVVPTVPPPGSGAHAARAASALRPGAEPWFPLADRCGADSAPNTPLPAEADATEPPEAAVEATPENTPAGEARAHFRFPTDSSAVRAIGRRSQPPSPLRKETSPPAGATTGGEGYYGRLTRVALDRRAAESPVPMGGAPPAAVARPEPRGPAPVEEPLAAEDREVLELTERAGAAAAWAPVEPPRPQVSDPRAGVGARLLRRPGVPARRAASVPARAVRARSVAVQTVDTWPAPYEFLVADFYRCLPDDERHQAMEDKVAEPPCSRLDEYLSSLYSGRVPADGAELAEQLALVHAQLMFERWRREAHAERNRRLLGRCRQARALELQNEALRERVRALRRERDELRAARRLQPAPPPPRTDDKDDALAAETAARLRAEAALREAESARAAAAAELQRERGEAAEAARRAEALARTALAAERRAEHVRRLRRELLVLGEREARLREAARAPPVPAAAGLERERAVRAALARAESDAEAAAARAEAAAVRAHELEIALAEREAAAAELRRGAKHAAAEHAARLRALQDKYTALMRVLRATEARQLQRLAAAELGAAAAGASAGAVTPGVDGPPPALAECSRVRRLLEEDPPAS